MSTLAARSAVVVALLFSSACGGNDGGPTDPLSDGLSPADARDLASAVARISANTSVAPTNSLLLANAPVSQTPPTETVNCTNGGTAVIDVLTPAGAELAAASINFRSCKEASEAGRVWTLTSDTPLRIGMSLSSTAQTDGKASFIVAMTLQGALHAKSGDSEGRCSIDATIFVTMALDAATASTPLIRIVGNSCGQPIDQTISR